MEISGSAIVNLLLRGLTEIDSMQLCLRSITPSGITISNDLKTLIFKDLINICDQGSEEPGQDSGAYPYSNYQYFQNYKISKSDPHWDTWSVAVVILEILIGSEFVLQARSNE